MADATTPRGCVDIATLREVYADNIEAQEVLDRIQASAANIPVQGISMHACAEFHCNNGRVVRFNVLVPPLRNMPVAAGGVAAGAPFPKLQGVPDFGATGCFTT